MALTTGTVKCISVSELAGFTRIEDSNGVNEDFILWFAGGIPASLNSFTRILHSMWLSMLREAQGSQEPVTISHPDNSAEVTNVRLGSL